MCAVCNVRDQRKVYVFKFLLADLAERAAAVDIALTLSGVRAHPECVTDLAKRIERKERKRGIS